MSVLIGFFGRIELVEQLQDRQFYRPESPNHYDPGQILVVFMLSVIAGAQRFAHANQLRAARALHARLGMKRFPSDDTFSHHPLLAVLAKANFVLHPWLRSGNTGAIEGVVHF